MPRIRRALGPAELPTPSTLCKAFNRFDIVVWRIILTLSATLLPTSGIVGVDVSGFDRSHASKHSTKRAELTIQQLKVTLLVDAKVNAIIDLHVTTTRKHDERISTLASVLCILTSCFSGIFTDHRRPLRMFRTDEIIEKNGAMTASRKTSAKRVVLAAAITRGTRPRYRSPRLMYHGRVRSIRSLYRRQL
jgi:hypothetical protein